MNIVNWTKDGLSEVTNNKNIIIKVDDSLLSTHSTVLPSSRGINTKKALSFALEDKLLSDIEELEFFSKKIDSAYNVIVIEKKLIHDIKTEIKEKKLSIKGVFPNFMFVPLAEDGVQYFDEGEYITYRDGLLSGGSMDKELFYEVFADEQTISTTELSTDYALVNLIQIDINDFVKKYITPWTSVLVLAFLSLLMYTYSTYISTTLLEKELKTLQQQNITLFKEAFPDITKIVDIRLQAENRMSKFTKQESIRTGDLLQTLENSSLPQNIDAIEYDGVLKVK